MESKSCGVLDTPLSRSMTVFVRSDSALNSDLRRSGMARQRQTSDVQLHIGESLDSGFDAEPVIGPRFARTRSHRPGMPVSRQAHSACRTHSSLTLLTISNAPRNFASRSKVQVTGSSTRLRVDHFIVPL